MAEKTETRTNREGQRGQDAARTGEHLCPWWVGYLLASPLRRLAEKPERILRPWIQPGATVVDYGSAMGFFTIPAARLVGRRGRVVAVDVQERMLRSLRRRAERRNLDAVIETRTCTQEDPKLSDLEGLAQLVVAFHVVHEVSDPVRVLEALAATLRPGGRLLLAEPRGHTSPETRAHIFGLVERMGLERGEELRLRKSDAAVFRRPS